MKFVLFIDALDPRDVQKYCPLMADDMIGHYDVGVPRVTPNIVSQPMTELPPGDDIAARKLLGSPAGIDIKTNKSINRTGRLRLF